MYMTVQKDFRAGDDIEDPSAYSIEDAKQKAEYDEMVRQAEERKADARKDVARLQQRFRRLLQQNDDSLPSHLRLDRREFELDPIFRTEMQRNRAEKIAQTERELAFETEKCEIAAKKLFDKYTPFFPLINSLHSEHES